MTGKTPASVGSLCSGYGGLELAVERLWPCARVAWHSEVDPYASTVLAARWPNVPNLGDLTDVDWAAVPRVDVLTAGYPCQPFSTAGRRMGEDDVRHLWPSVLRAVCQLRPRLVLLENVAGHLSLGFGRVLGDLAEVGFDAEWRCLRASDVGACHRRERVFIAAYPDGEAGRRFQPGGGPGSLQRSAVDERPQVEPRRRHGGDRPAVTVAPADVEPAGRNRRTTPRPQSTAPTDAERFGPQGLPACGLRLLGGDDEPSRRGESFGPFQLAVDRWATIVGRPAPAGLDDGRRLNARFVEWMMGLTEGWVTDLVPRRHALRILGNGVVPQQAAAAYRSLLGEAL